jgi:hypothetical protein
VTFNEKSEEKIKIVKALQHPMSTKVIKRNFELSSNGNLRSTGSGLDVDFNYGGNAMMENLRGKILTARNGTLSNDKG